MSEDVHGSEEIDGVHIPCVKVGYDRDKFARETKDDPSLKPFRELADRRERGYFWDNEILMQQHTDPVGGMIECIVVPKDWRKQILHHIQDQMGHLGHRNIVTITKRNFVWPLLHKEARLYCESCPYMPETE